MALVFERQNPRGNNGGPETHALVIGVGGYEHLVGGRDPKPQVIPQIGILRQLTTAPRSAVAFADFLIEHAEALIQPLGTVELLISTAPDDTAFQAPAGFGAADGATFAEVQTAYDEWRSRLDENEDNVAIFYHCGHGVEKEEQYLLTQDFGRFPNNPWLGAFTFDSTQMAMRACKAKTQCFFVDACREITDSMKEHDFTVAALETIALDESENESTFVVRGAAAKETALGPKNGVAYCTQALIRALGGDAAEDRGAGWAVRTGIVADRITDILRLIKEDEAFKGRCPCTVTRSTEIIRLDHAPKVDLQVACAPDAATSVAEFTCQSLVDQAAPPHQQSGGPLSVRVDAGFYRVGAHFPQGQFRDSERPIPASPVMLPQTLDCAP